MAGRLPCYDGKDYLTTLRVYGDGLLNEAGSPFRLMQSQAEPILVQFKEFMGEVWRYEQRVVCASNLRNLYNRFRFFTSAEGERVTDSRGMSDRYPAASTWCDSLVNAYSADGVFDDYLSMLFNCPNTSQGKSDYAMNEVCRYDSPGEVVLLFETEAGWNQHGGPERFKFDNHDPRGGLVVLNDGTVKFIRTEEELKQLRWK